MKKGFIIIYAFVFASLILTSCSENYSNGERIGMVTQFSRRGMFYKSWEGSLNLTQTGMNSSGAEPFVFSVDNDNEDTAVIKKIDSAAQFGWKVKIVYHETYGKNWLGNRGSTNHFVRQVEVLDRNPMGSVFGNKTGTGHSSDTTRAGHIIDTIYVVIDNRK